MTPRQVEILRFIAAFIREVERPPTRVDIARHFGWRSANAAEDHLRALERKGLVSLTRGVARGVAVTNAGMVVAQWAPAAERHAA